MSSLTIEYLILLLNDYKNYSCFIETNTNEGITVLNLEPFFDKIYTIECNKKYYNIAKNKYNGNKINYILGDSPIIFEKLLPTINENSIFYLDAHLRTTVRTLEDEIIHINNLFKNEAVLIIDNLILLGTEAHINKDKLLKILEKRIRTFYHFDGNCGKDDRLIIHINAL
jgi:hypothetical protein